ncbi:MAG: NAD-dependent epimerase/dehydratase family protein [Chitinophagales bacterium]|nr:NAD-dependent epimerase/dehydratase family protein [Chitinophagales bacterium]
MNEQTNRDTPVLVTGATGFLGAYLIQHLLAVGYTNIRGLHRPNSPMELVKAFEKRVEWFSGDVMDIFTLEEALKDVKLVFHCAAIVSFTPSDREEMMQVNVEGTANIVNLSLDMGIDKLVFVSSIAAIGRTKEHTTLDENSKWERSSFNTNYAISKFKAEQEVWRGIAEGLNAAIVNPGIILGSSKWNAGTARFFELMWKGYSFYPAGTTSLVDVRDVAAFMTLLMESDISAERFILHSEHFSYHKLLSTISKYLNKKPPTIKVSPILKAIAWRLAWLQSKLSGKPPLLTKETANNSSRVFYYNNQKSVEALNFEYIPIENTIKETASQFLEAAANGFPAMMLPPKTGGE